MIYTYSVGQSRFSNYLYRRLSCFLPAPISLQSPIQQSYSSQLFITILISLYLKTSLYTEFTLTESYRVTSKYLPRRIIEIRQLTCLEEMSTGIITLPDNSSPNDGQPLEATAGQLSSNSSAGHIQEAETCFVDLQAFQSVPNIFELLQDMQCHGKSLITSSLTTRVEKVLQRVENFMGSLGSFIQHISEMSSLVIDRVKYILTVSAITTYSILM